MKDQDEKKQGGQPQERGHAGYSPKKEQELVNKENETMHNERDEKDLDTSKEQRSGIDENEGSDPRKGRGV